MGIGRLETVWCYAVRFFGCIFGCQAVFFGRMSVVASSSFPTFDLYVQYSWGQDPSCSVWHFEISSTLEFKKEKSCWLAGNIFYFFSFSFAFFPPGKWELACCFFLNLGNFLVGARKITCFFWNATLLSPVLSSILNKCMGAIVAPKALPTLGALTE